MDNSTVCADVSQELYQCLNNSLLSTDVRERCQNDKRKFDECIDRWRASAGPISVRGKNPGEPAPQCAALACLIGKCATKTNYDFSRCTAPMEFFKHCVKSFSGVEYV